MVNAKGMDQHRRIATRLKLWHNIKSTFVNWGAARGGITIQDARSIENLVEDVSQTILSSDQGIQSVSIVSKTGLLVAGRVSSSVRPETFSAMSAIMFSSAEATKTDAFKDRIEHIVAVFKNSKLFAIELSSSLLLVVVAKKDMQDAQALESMHKAATKIKEELVWLR